MSQAITLDVISDTICPWCYIGKRRLEQALSQRPDLDIEVYWRPYQLDPTIPPGGIERASYLERKFGGPDAARSIYARIEEAGEAEGIPFAFDRIAVTPSTLDSHRLIRWAATAGVQDAVVERLFALYFTEGQDIGDPNVLVSAAGDAGMDADLVANLLQGESDIDLVEKEIALAQQIGVTGVPCFVFAHRYAVMGAQEPASIVDAIDRVSTELAKGTGTTG